MATKTYKHTDVGAPTNTNAAGSLIALLTACLVTGYGSKAAAGWSKPYTNGTVAAFQTGEGSNGRVMWVSDSATTAARVKCFESFDSVAGVGSGQFPSEIQAVGGLYMPKSDVATAKSWTVVANERFFIAVIENNAPIMSAFGDFDTKKTGDTFNTIAIFSSTASGTDANAINASGYGAISGHYLARQHTNVGSSIPCGKVASTTGQTALGGTSPLPYPSPIDGSLHISRLQITEPNVGIRGELPLIYNINHTKPLQNLDSVSGTGEFTGKTFLALNLSTSSQCLVDIT